MAVARRRTCRSVSPPLYLAGSLRLALCGLANCKRETSSAGSNDCEADKRSKSTVDGCWNHQNAHQPNRLLLRDKFFQSSSNDEAGIPNLPGLLLFEYLEQEQPHLRKPLIDKVD
ncbi:uncharacterized protein Fot_16893 [Forsythia ovata]|uniref:Uncharacterized protein n=1 Tax=Forsythia ovata TaxID=205694 RepID=A0ABD1VDV2_9LAMI